MMQSTHAACLWTAQQRRGAAGAHLLNLYTLLLVGFLAVFDRLPMLSSSLHKCTQHSTMSIVSSKKVGSMHPLCFLNWTVSHPVSSVYIPI